MTVTSLALTTALLTFAIAARYLLVAGLVHWAFWRKARPIALEGRLRARPASLAEIAHEVRLSLASSVIYAFPAAIVWEAFKAGETKIYLDPLAYHPLWLIGGLLTYLLVQDVYYYFVHRLLHHPKIYRHAHAGHHRALRPTAFASFAFDPAEAALTAWLLPALTFLIPIHLGAIVAALAIMTAAAVLNHAGVEVWPRRWLARAPLSWFITAAHHDLHHQRQRTNFGLYLRCWDQLFGTEAPSTATVAAPSKAPTAARTP